MAPRYIAVAAALLLAAATRADLVDDYAKRIMHKQHIPGMTVAVLIKDKVVKIKGYGYANLELNSPANPNTVYEIGSITKQFTATAIMMLVEQGKVSLDDEFRSTWTVRLPPGKESRSGIFSLIRPGLRVIRACCPSSFI
jgi:CubicO group peptidase (beta-lactamase class C family)